MINPSGMGWVLLIVGLLVAGVGLFWIIAPSIPWLGRLPGDIRIEGEKSGVYIPLATCLLASLVLTGLLWLMRWLFRQ